jgi:hypothetical protein
VPNDEGVKYVVPSNFVPVDNSGSIMGLVELPAERLQSPNAITLNPQIQP